MAKETTNQPPQKHTQIRENPEAEEENNIDGDFYRVTTDEEIELFMQAFAALLKDEKLRWGFTRLRSNLLASEDGRDPFIRDYGNSNLKLQCAYRALIEQSTQLPEAQPYLDQIGPSGLTVSDFFLNLRTISYEDFAYRCERWKATPKYQEPPTESDEDFQMRRTALAEQDALLRYASEQDVRE